MPPLFSVFPVFAVLSWRFILAFCVSLLIIFLVFLCMFSSRSDIVICCLFCVFLWCNSYYSLDSFPVFFNRLFTSSSLIFLLRLYATIGTSGHSIFKVGSLSMRCQCFFKICPMCVVLVLKGMLNVGRVFVLSGLSL